MSMDVDGPGDAQRLRQAVLASLFDFVGAASCGLLPGMAWAPETDLASQAAVFAQPEIGEDLSSLCALALPPDHNPHTDTGYEWPVGDSVGSTPQQCQVHRWRGMIASPRIVRMLKQLRAQQEQGRFAWAALIVHGFRDAPTLFQGQEHHVGTDGGGQGDLVLCMLPGGRYALFAASGAGDGFRSF